MGVMMETETKIRGNALTRFAREHCANWDPGQGECVSTPYEGPCLLAQGKQCEYFEKAAFPICDPSYRYATEIGKYDKLSALYLDISPNMAQRKTTARFCECGAPLKKRRQYCDKCRIQRQKNATKARVKKHRSGVTL